MSSARVRLAILKLADGDIEKLARSIQVATVDYRDTLAWAESPNLLDLPPSADPDSQAYRRAISADTAQYESWLAS